MSAVKRSVPLALAVLAVAAGAALIMGNRPGTREQVIRMEQTRVETLARSWEFQITAARSMFRDQLIRHGLLDALDHPEEWSSDRVSGKLSSVSHSWGKEAGVPLTLALLRSDGSLHTYVGDSSRLKSAVRALSSPGQNDVVLLARSEAQPELLALEFQTPALQLGHRPGHMIGLIGLPGFLAGVRDIPSGWALLAGPGKPLIVSQSGPARIPINDATWPLLLSQGTGTIPLENGTTLCFSRIQVPAMEPLLLVLPLSPARSALVPLAIILICAGLAGMVWLQVRRWKTQPATMAFTQPSVPREDTLWLRQVFHSLDDPICVVNSAGEVIRANNKAHHWFHFHRGRPRDDLTVWRDAGDCLLTELLAMAAEDPEAASGRMSLQVEGMELEGVLRAERIEGSDDGAVMLQFKLGLAASETPSATNSESNAQPGEPDPYCPYPVLSVSTDGLVVGFNDAARRSCARLDESPLITDILPALSDKELPKLLAAVNGHTFESLFGPRPHEFRLVRREGQLYLYGHPLSASKNLEIEMKQAQQNFYTLCALSALPVILADPRDHSILEANAAAADLLQTTPPALRGRALADFSAEPWELNNEDSLYIARGYNGIAIRCRLQYELIKVEGAPTLLIVLEPESEPLLPDYPEIVPQATVMDSPPSSPEPLPLPPGPGLLITLNPTVRETARRMFEKTGHDCESFSSLDDVTVWLITHDVRPEFVAIDLTDFDGIDGWLEELRARCGDVPCLAFTDGDPWSLPNDGLNAFLAKPFDFESLIAALATLKLDHALFSSTA
ncbi:PAS domain-containing protein [bacterium]|nr:PAS domain-containing protein [bacterium]